MLHLSNALTVAFLWVNLTGLALAVRRWIGTWPMARVASPVALVAALFFVEHFFGLGRLDWTLPLTTGISVWRIWSNWAWLRERWETELLFAAGFVYALAWRYAFPDIGASSEKITDATFVANYLGGTRLPPVDRWLPPFHFEMYYGLQHYAAALIGRILNSGPGTAYNLGFATIVALAATAAGAGAVLLVNRRLPAILLTASFVLGGAGTAPFIHGINPSPPLHASVRFIGSYFTPETATRRFGRWLLGASHVTSATPDLPMETFSYLIGLGDFHPPLSGYLLLTVALLAIAQVEAGVAMRASLALLGATVPLMIAANCWQFPLQAALVGGYVLARTLSRKDVEWKALLAGFGASLWLMAPFLMRFGASQAGSPMALRLVPAFARTPPILWLLNFWPLLALIALHLVLGGRMKRELLLCLLFLALLAFAEAFYVDDLYSGKFERFNSVLKWWAWIYSAGMLLIGAFNLRAASRVCRWTTAAVLIAVCAFSGDLSRQYFGIGKLHLGQLDGAGAIRDDAGERVIFDLLRNQPPSIVLQRIPAEAYTPPPVLTILAGQTAYLGWPGHEKVWRGNRADIDARKREVDAFYSGEHPDASRWLQANGIGYVLWLRDENQLAPGTFERVNAQIQDRYVWRAYYQAGEYRVGLWQARRLITGFATIRGF